MSRWGRVKGTKSPLRVQSSSFLNFLSSENWTAAGRKGFFDTLCRQCKHWRLYLFLPTAKMQTNLSYFVAADCISFAATFYALHKKSLLIHFVAAPPKIVTALLGHDFVFPAVTADDSVRSSQTVTQRSGRSLERKKEPANMELSPPRRKHNAAGFF